MQSWIAKKSKFTIKFSHLIKKREKQKETQRAAEGPSFLLVTKDAGDCSMTSKQIYTIVTAYSVNHLVYVLEKTWSPIL